MLQAIAAARALRADAGPRPAALWVNIVFYFGAAAILVVFGVGTMRVRRWARVLMLLVSWSFLAAAIVGIAGGMVFLPGMMERIEPAGADPAVARIAVYAVLVVVGVFMIGLPAFFIAAYSGRHVRHTFATRHPERCWVDGRPPAVLALALVMALFGLLQVAGAWTGLGVLFGVPLQGKAAVVANILIAGAWIGLGYGLYRLSRAAWIASFVFVILAHLSAYLTYRSMSFLEMGYRLGWGAGEAGLMGGLAPTIERWSSLSAVLMAAAWIVSLAAVRRHYRPGPRV